jgi:hypothetical protein
MIQSRWGVDTSGAGKSQVIVRVAGDWKACGGEIIEEIFTFAIVLVAVLEKN